MINYMGQSYKNHADMMEDIKAGHIRHYQGLVASFRSSGSMEAIEAMMKQADILMKRFGMTGAEIEALED